MKTILHLDDEAGIRELLATFLGAANYRVLSVATPTEAITLAGREPIDLVIADLQLDEADGLTTIDVLRHKLGRVPVIILTGVLLSPGTAQEVFGQSVDCYLEKTVPLARIRTEVARLLGE